MKSVLELIKQGNLEFKIPEIILDDKKFKIILYEVIQERYVEILR